MMKFINLLIYFSFFIAVCLAEKKESESEASQLFVPTNEWKVVKLGQRIPPGLHVRTNFQTGITEAKLLDPNEKSTKNSVAVSKSNKKPEFDEIKTFSKKILKQQLKNIKNEIKQDQFNKTNGTNFRSYEQLKKELGEMKFNIKSDLEIIRELHSELNNITNTKRQIEILKELEYLLHQIDNAQTYFDMGGLNMIVKFLESKDNELKLQAVGCLTSALQGNAKAKIVAIKYGILTKLIAILKSSSSKPGHLTSKVISTISALTRHFPLAQSAFVQGGGLNLLANVFERLLENQDDYILIKILTLISDWLQERVTMFKEEISESEDKITQYKKINMVWHLTNEGWCGLIQKLFVAVSSNHKSVDNIEKVLTAFINLSDGQVCQCVARRSSKSETQFIDCNVILNFLDVASVSVTNLQNNDTDDDFYYNDILKLIENVRSRVVHTPDLSKNEL